MTVEVLIDTFKAVDWVFNNVWSQHLPTHALNIQNLWMLKSH